MNIENKENIKPGIWFDIKYSNKNIPFPNQFKKAPFNDQNKIQENFPIVDRFKNDSKKKITLPDHLIDNIKFNNKKTFLRAYKYQIHFTKKQGVILNKFSLECDRLYNICVDLWKIDNKISDNSLCIYPSIFDIVYRNPDTNKLTNEEQITLIHKRLEKNKEDYVKNILPAFEKKIEKYEKEKKENDTLHKEKMNKYKSLMKKYKKDVKNNNKLKPPKKPNKKKITKPKISDVKEKKEINKRIKKPAPDEVLKLAVKSFCSALKTNRTNLAEGNIKKFQMKYKDSRFKYTFALSDRNIGKKGIFSSSLKKLECKKFDKIMEKHGKIEHECKLQYDKVLKKYYLFVPIDQKMKDIKNRKPIVAIDPGEKIMMAYYSHNEYGKIGDEMRNYILSIQKKIRILQSIKMKNKNKNGKAIKHKKHIKKKIHLLFLKIENYVNEHHRKGAKYLCENYERILLPDFQVQPLLRNKKRHSEYTAIHKIKNIVKAKEKLKVLKKEVKLSGRVKYVLQMQSHYRFKKYLQAKSEVYGTKIYRADEAYTTMTCTKCGSQESKYKYREKECKKCKYKIDRDLNGSRNILLKNCVVKAPWLMAKNDLLLES